MSLIERALAKSNNARGGQSTTADPIQVLPGAPSTYSGGEWSVRPELPVAEFQEDAGGAASGIWMDTAAREIFSRFYSIRREILDAATELRDQGLAPIVLVTSAIPSDGKTFVSLGLAKALASVREFTTTLVDADLIRRRLSGVWNLEGQPGLAECIRDEVTPQEVVRRTTADGVEIIGAGRPKTDAAEELASTRIREVFEAMAAAGPRRLFVVDAPPALSVSEITNLARYAHIVVVVVRANSTPVPAVTETIAMFADRKCLVLLNGADTDSRWLGAGYYKVPYER